LPGSAYNSPYPARLRSRHVEDYLEAHRTKARVSIGIIPFISKPINQRGSAFERLSFCPQCGRPHESEQQFCTHCGANLRPEAQASGTASGNESIPKSSLPSDSERTGVTPVVKIFVVSSASIGGPIDPGKVAKAFPNPGLPPSSNIFRLNKTIISVNSSSGKLFCRATSEEEASRSIEEVLGRLRTAGIRVQGAPVVKVEGAGGTVFLMRGISIQALPDYLPDSLYCHEVREIRWRLVDTPEGPSVVRIDPQTGLAIPSVFGKREKIEGKYNIGGRVGPIRSEKDVAKAFEEISGEKPDMFRARYPPLNKLSFLNRTIVGGNASVFFHAAYYKMSPSVDFEMLRHVDVDRNMLMTGEAQLQAKNVSEALEAVHAFERKLEEAGLLGPLTPRSKIPESWQRRRIFDYFANDSAVWEGAYTTPPHLVW